MSENGEIYTAGNKFYTPAGTDGMDKFHLCLSVRGREFAEGALREAYVVSRVRRDDTSQFVPSFDQICTSKGISCLVDRRQKVWNGLKEGFGLSKLPISAEP